MRRNGMKLGEFLEDLRKSTNTRCAYIYDKDPYWGAVRRKLVIHQIMDVPSTTIGSKQNTTEFWFAVIVDSKDTVLSWAQTESALPVD